MKFFYILIILSILFAFVKSLGVSCGYSCKTRRIRHYCKNDVKKQLLMSLSEKPLFEDVTHKLKSCDVDWTRHGPPTCSMMIDIMRQLPAQYKQCTVVHIPWYYTSLIQEYGGDVVQYHSTAIEYFQTVYSDVCYRDTRQFIEVSTKLTWTESFEEAVTTSLQITGKLLEDTYFFTSRIYW